MHTKFMLKLIKEWKQETKQISLKALLLFWQAEASLHISLERRKERTGELPQAIKALWLPLNSSPDSGGRNVTYDIQA